VDLVFRMALKDKKKRASKLTLFDFLVESPTICMKSDSYKIQLVPHEQTTEMLRKLDLLHCDDI
jgi:hypothetical protein